MSRMKVIMNRQAKIGPLGESNPGPPAPEAGIMPLDQADVTSRAEN
jgi:hypothetical protein